MAVPLTFWIGFNVVVLALLTLDLSLSPRDDAPRSLARLVWTTGGWIVLALGFGLWITLHAGTGKGLEYFTGYVIEYALSLDNIFLFVLIFSTFAIAPVAQHRVLFWGVIGALAMRGAMILAGTAILQRFEWVIYLFGAYILYAGVSMFFHREDRDIGNQPVVRWARRILPISRELNSGRFLVREDGRLKFTVLFLVLIVVELTDLVFALDSIPAIFGVTTDPFIVYTSNICAILGLRSLYFLLARAVKSLIYLQAGLGGVLVFIGAKMVAQDVVTIPTGVSLLVVAVILMATVAASLLKSRREGKDTVAHS